jgi:hypothetical protein
MEIASLKYGAWTLNRRSLVSPGPGKFTSGETAVTSAAGTPTSSPLVGRDDEVGALTNALDVALAGRAQILAITGEPGIGKKRICCHTYS